MNIRPVNGQILVTECEPIYQHVGLNGIEVPQNLEGTAWKGMVLKKDETPLKAGAEPAPVICKVGDVVFFSPHTCETLIDDFGQGRMLIHESQIRAVVSDVKAKVKDSNPQNKPKREAGTKIMVPR